MKILKTNQRITSANTSINSKRVPALFKHRAFKPEGFIVDIGGGKWDNAVDYVLTTYGNHMWVYDPYNRTRRHNKIVEYHCNELGGFDTVTCSNVLNVIEDESDQDIVIRNCYNMLKPGGTAYFYIYEGDKSRNGRETRAGYQCNRPAADYMLQIAVIFDSEVTRRGQMLIVKKAEEK